MRMWAGLHAAAAAAKSTPADLQTKIESMMEEIKALHSENEKLKEQTCQRGNGRCYGSGSGCEGRKSSHQSAQTALI